jgi:site-specific DNA-cytosine methylase
MGGMKGPMKKPNGKPTRKALALRKWHCESVEQLEQLLMIAESALNPIDPAGLGTGEQLKQELAKELRRQRQSRAYQDQQLKQAMARHHEDDGEQDYETLDEIKQRLDAKCWKGKHKEGTKIKGGVRVNNCVPNESVAESEEPSTKGFVHKFAPWVAEQLGIRLPKIVLLDQPKDTTFGQYVPDERCIYLVIGGRHPVDVLRTLAHELTHHKQHINNDLPDGAGATGTDQENEANANAGIMMRDFAKNNPEYFGVK